MSLNVRGQERIRTMLCVLRSVADHSAASASNLRAEVFEDAQLELSGRIRAIARVSQAWNGEGIDLESLVLDELLLHAVHGDIAEVRGCDARLPPKTAELMSLAIHELAANAVKFGALCVPGGRIKIGWQFVHHHDGRRLRFEWAESGVTIQESSPRPGFGFEVVERLVARMLKGEGKMVMLSGGVHCTIEIPMGPA